MIEKDGNDSLSIEQKNKYKLSSVKSMDLLISSILDSNNNNNN
jgi:hypothetical protein